MNGLELLKKYPKATSCIRRWFMQRMIDSFDDLTVPKEFKDSMLDAGISTDKIATMIEAQPRSLFDVFDDNQIFIFTDPELHPLDRTLFFTYNIIYPNGHRFKIIECSSRREAEELAIEEAFEMLEEKLT